MPSTVLQVALPRPLPQAFDYLPPAGEAAGADWIGCRVRVPFGRRTLVGVVTGVGPAASGTPALKAVDARLDARPLLDGEAWDLLGFTARYYHAPFGEVWATALPGPLREGDPAPEVHPPRWRLTPSGLAALPMLRPGRPRRVAERLLVEGALEAASLDAAEAGSRDALRRLAERGLVEATHAPPPPRAVREPPELNDAQRAAASAIGAAKGFTPLLLEGVTGSGKTEVYLEAIRGCLARGRQALVLVPEIGLTGSTLARLQAGLPVEVHAAHSGRSDGERARAFAAMASGAGRVLVGTRSAVFTPLPEAGLLVVDEEHDASYKQQDGVRYHARDLALVRGRSLGVPVVLGSATPSLESLKAAIGGRLGRLVLPKRARPGAQAPTVRVVDVRKRRLEGGLAPELVAALADTVARGEQALVFRNRRGYAPVLLCHDCGWSAPCRRCDAHMTVHAGGRRLVCHHCGATQTRPPACPDCGSLALQPQGQGTERLEEALQAALPEVPVVRVDRDTTAVKDGLARRLATLGDGPGVLVGTQMLAKGHDLPGLTLSAIVSLDEGLFSADVRAGERMGQLLVQVAGRAGRAARPGEVWLQTHHPEHPWLALLLSGGYPALAAALLAEREAARLPPYAHWALVRAEAPVEAAATAFLGAVVDTIAGGPGLSWSGPMPAPMARRAGRARVQLLLQAEQRPPLQAALAAAVPGWYDLPEARRVRWSLDVDPIDLL